MEGGSNLQIVHEFVGNSVINQCCFYQDITSGIRSLARREEAGTPRDVLSLFPVVPSYNNEARFCLRVMEHRMSGCRDILPSIRGTAHLIKLKGGLVILCFLFCVNSGLFIPVSPSVCIRMPRKGIYIG